MRVPRPTAISGRGVGHFRRSKGVGLRRLRAGTERVIGHLIEGIRCLRQGQLTNDLAGLAFVGRRYVEIQELCPNGLVTKGQGPQELAFQLCARPDDESPQAVAMPIDQEQVVLVC